MRFWENYSNADVLNIVIPIVIGVFIILFTLLLRKILFGRLHKWSKRTESHWDDIIIAATHRASLVWCLWLGIYGGLKSAALPSGWVENADKAVLIIFAVMGIYTVVSLIEIGLNWYSIEVAAKTKSSLDDIIMVALKWGVPLIAIILGIFLILEMTGYGVAPVNNWLQMHGGRLALLFILTLVFLLGSTMVIPKTIKAAVCRSRAEQTEEELNKRAETLTSVLTASVQVIVILIFVFMLLSEIGINIAPVLAGVGIAGIAIGFGAQSMVKDIIAGLFIIIENQYRKGDVVKIADVAGLVEDINLRRTVLRDLDGIVHVVPNGEIRVASDFTKGWSRVNMNISVSYGTDLDHAIAVINRVGEELANDPKWAPLILKPPQVLRVDNLGDSGIDIKILGDTKPIEQWGIMGELRLRLKKEFDKEGIEIPWPHTKIYFGNSPSNPT
ncbi:MAG TPA: mechanosensitive ion channel domain-containing protein [Dehalococcoidia bacterium]|nr:mechanosensitive ion channel domain-containing protein [Dehalococcoidia bacterium]